MTTEANTESYTVRLRRNLQEAKTLVKQGRLDDAALLLRETRSFARIDRSVLLELSNVLETQKQFAEARSLSEELIIQYPSALTYRRLGLLLVRMGDLDAAEPHLRRSLDMDPENAPTALTLARMLNNRNDIEEAIGILKGVVDSEQNYVPALYQYALLLRRTNRKAEAESTFKKIVSLDKTHVKSVIELLTLYEERRARADGALVGNEYLDHSGPNLVVALKTANFEMLLGNKPAAEKLFYNVLDIDSNNMSALFNLQKILYGQKRRREAKEIHQRIKLNIKKNFPSSLEQAVAQLYDNESLKLNSEGFELPTRSFWAPEKRLNWGVKIGGLLSHWMHFIDQGSNEIQKLCSSADWEKYKLDSSGSIFVGSQIGPNLLAVADFLRSGSNCKVVVSNPSFLLSDLAPKAIDLTFEATSDIMAALASFIEKKEHIFMYDNGFGMKTKQLFEHKKCAFSFTNAAPMMAYVTKAPIYACFADWGDQSAVIKIVDGPQVNAGETLERWLDRWFQFFWSQTILALEKCPENLNRLQFNRLYNML